MQDNNTKSTTPELRRVIGALIYGAPEPLTIKGLKKILVNAAEGENANLLPPAAESGFAGISEKEIREAVEALRRDLEERPLGIQLVEIAEGYRLFTDPECSPWMRHVLQTEKPARLSRPSLETLAIIAYRQPATRSEIEAVRGVNVDYVVRNLMELQLVRIVGRSELPGKPLLYGTTQRFLEHFGLKDLHELPGISELARRDQAATATDSAKVKTPPQAQASDGVTSNQTVDDPTEADADAGSPPVDAQNENGPDSQAVRQNDGETSVFAEDPDES